MKFSLRLSHKSRILLIVFALACLVLLSLPPSFNSPRLHTDLMKGPELSSLYTDQYIDEYGSIKHLIGEHDKSQVSIDALVEKALKPWQLEGVSEENLMGIFGFRQGEGCFMVQLIDGQLYMWHPLPQYAPAPEKDAPWPFWLFSARRSGILQLIHLALNTNSVASIGNIEMVFCLGDCIVSQGADSTLRNFAEDPPIDNDPAPAFTIVRCDGSMNIPFPMWENSTKINWNDNFDKWDRRVDEILANAALHPFIQRKDQAVFRGGERSCFFLGGKMTKFSNDFANPDLEKAKRCGRTALLHAALTAGIDRDKFDVAFTSAGQDWSKFWGPQDEPNQMPMSEQERFKAVIYAEGHCGWASRLRVQLHMGSALLLQETPCIEHYGMLLKPWVHYIPVKYDFSDLVEKTSWVMEHPNDVMSMVDRMHAYSEKILTKNAVVEYVEKLLFGYSKLQSYEVKLRDGAILYEGSI